MSEEEKKDKSKHSLSRRQFLIDAGLVVGGATIGSMAFVSACNGSETTKTVTSTVSGAGSTATLTKTNTVTTTVTESGTGSASMVAEKAVKLNINGNERVVGVRPNWTLQWVLNDRLGLLGAKEWCNEGACGSCTVNIDGRPVLSCMILAIECEGKTIETVEGIAAANHPIVQAYIDNNCMQCGYCTPGFVVTAKALLDRNPNPSEEEIREALGGNLCRCATYQQHPLAVMQAAKALK